MNNQIPILFLLIFFVSCSNDTEKRNKFSYELTGFETANILQKNDLFLCLKYANSSDIPTFLNFNVGDLIRIENEIMMISVSDFSIPNNCLIVERGERVESLIKAGEPVFLLIEYDE